MLPHALQQEMTAIKRRLKAEIRASFPALAPFCRAYSLYRGGTDICVSRPTYPTPNQQLEDFLADKRDAIKKGGIFDLVTDYPTEWRAIGLDGGCVAPDSCEFLWECASSYAVTDGSSCFFYSEDYFESQRSRWPATAPLPPRYWEQRQYINDQYQLLCRWIELHGTDNLPDIDDISPSMVAAKEPLRQYRQISDAFEPAW